MLGGPILLAGYRRLSDKLRKGHANLGDIWSGSGQMPRGLGGVLRCGLLF